MSTAVVFGATGYAGSRIAAELVRRGHHVIAVARDVSAVPADREARAGSVHDAAFVREVTDGVHDVVVALHAAPGEEGGPTLLDALPALRDAAESAGARLALVGGAGSLHVSEGGPLLFDTPDFPAAFAGEAKAHGAVLEALREDTTGLDWLYVSPAASFGSYNPGERTGTYRLGGDVLLSDAEGRSDISGDDFALAFVDALEDRTQRRRRISVAY